MIATTSNVERPPGVERRPGELAAEAPKKKQRPTFKQTWSRLAPLFGATRGRMIGLSASTFVGGIAEAVVVLLVVKVALVIAAGHSETSLAFAGIEMTLTVGEILWVSFGAAMLRLVLHIIGAYISTRMSADVIDQIRRGLFDDYIRASWDVQSKEEEGHLIDLMQRHVGRASTAVLNISNGLNSFFNFVALMISAFVLNVAAASAIIVSTLAMFVLLRPITRRTRAYAAEQSEAGRHYAKTMLETVGVSMEIRTFSVTDPVTRNIHALSKAEREPFTRAQFLTKMMTPLHQTVAILILIGGMLVVYLFVDSEIASLGAIILILVRAMNYSEGLQMTYHRVIEILPFAERLDEERIRFRASVQARKDDGKPAPKIAELGFENVSFSYVADRPALQNVDFSFKAGEAIGIVGPSGSGKSTLVQLLLRLREPSSGRYLVNGTDAKDLDLASWFRRIAFVPQDSRMLSMSVIDNIRFFRDDIDDAAIEKAAKLAHIHEDIVSWPNGYQTTVGPRGNAISGGQRQRLALARALAASPDLIVLDEPTSALDLQSEKLIHETLADLKGQVTMVLIAHRLSTLTICDRIMVLGDGKLQAFDKREVLETQNEFYRGALELSRVH